MIQYDTIVYYIYIYIRPKRKGSKAGDLTPKMDLPYIALHAGFRFDLRLMEQVL